VSESRSLLSSWPSNHVASKETRFISSIGLVDGSHLIHCERTNRRTTSCTVWGGQRQAVKGLLDNEGALMYIPCVISSVLLLGASDAGLKSVSIDSIADLSVQISPGFVKATQDASALL
jgi:hypothetical protein